MAATVPAGRRRGIVAVQRRVAAELGRRTAGAWTRRVSIGYTSPVLTLGDLVHDLGPSVVDLALAPHGTDVGLAGLIVHDPLDPMALHRGDVVLGVGLAGGAAAPLLASMQTAQAAALVVKAAQPADAQLLAAAESAGVALLTVPVGASWTQVVLLLRQLMSREGLGVAPETVGGVAAGDLFAVANAIAAVVDAPVTIEDPQSRVIAFSNRQEEADAARAVSILGRQVPESYLQRLRQLGVFRRLAQERTPVYIEGIAEDVQPRVAIAIHAGEEMIGSLWAAVDGPLSPQREQALVEAAGFVSLHLLRHRLTSDVERGLQAQLVATVLEGSSLAGDAAQRLGLPPGAYRVLAVGVGEHDAADDDVELLLGRCWELLALHVSPIHRRAATALIARVVYALLPVSGDPGLSLPPVRELATGFVARATGVLRRPMVAGIGGHAPGLAAVPRSRSEADQVLRVIRSKPGIGSAAEIGDVQSEVLLMKVGDLCAGEPILERGPVAALQALDARNHTAHVATLRAYLDAFGDCDAAAAELRVHPNTVRNRMRQLQQTAGIDLGDSEARLALTLQLRLLGDRNSAVGTRDGHGWR